MLAVHRKAQAEAVQNGDLREFLKEASAKLSGAIVSSSFPKR